MGPTTRRAPVAVGAALAVLLTACSADEPMPRPSPSSEPEAVFETEEEALAAAEAAYTEYLAVSDAVAQDGGRDVGRLGPLVTPDYLQSQTADYSILSADQLRLVGETKLVEARLQNQRVERGETVVTVYLCVDVSGTDILDESGELVTPPNRVEVYPLVAEFESNMESAGQLRLSSSSAWSGENYC